MLEDLLNIFQGFFLIKIGFLIISGFYIAFLFVVLKQAHAMQGVIADPPASTLINTIALANVFLGISLFVAALVIL